MPFSHAGLNGLTTKSKKKPVVSGKDVLASGVTVSILRAIFKGNLKKDLSAVFRGFLLQSCR
jgi:hypothetical protein